MRFLCNLKNAMKPRFSHNVYLLSHYSHVRRFQQTHRRTFSSFFNNIRSIHFGARASSLGGGGGGGRGGEGGGGGGGGGGEGGTGDSKGNAFLLPGATMATILMLGALHARRLYEDKKIEEKRERGIELEFHPDVKASFLGILPLRSISRTWGCLTSLVFCLRKFQSGCGRMFIKHGLELFIQILKKQLYPLKNMLHYGISLFAA